MSKETASRAAPPPQSREALTADIERTRHDLGETVEALVARADVKARARHRAAEVAGSLRGKLPAAPAAATTAAAAALVLAWLTVRRHRR